MNDDFGGCKLAYIINGELLVYKRDDFPRGGERVTSLPKNVCYESLKKNFLLLWRHPDSYIKRR